MKRLNELNGRDLQRLSAYLDGELSSKEAARLETRLAAEPHLQKALNDLTLTSKLVSSLPKVQPPRNFMLTPEMVGVQKKRSVYPAFQFATIVASVAFVILIGADVFFLSENSSMNDTMLASAPEIMFEEQPVQAFEAAEAPVEKAMQVEELLTPTEEVMAEIIIEGEGDRSPPEAPSVAGINETEEFGQEKTEAFQTDQPQNAMTAPPEGTPFAAIAPVQDEPTDPVEEQHSTPTQVPVPLPESTEMPSIDLDNDPSGLRVEPIRITEIGLGLAAVLLAGITFYLHRRR